MMLLKIDRLKDGAEADTAAIEYNDATGVLYFRTWTAEGFRSSEVAAAEAKAAMTEFLAQVLDAELREWAIPA